MSQEAIELIKELRSSGVALKAVGTQLRYSPVSAVTPEQIERLRANKAEILTELSDSKAMQNDLQGSHSANTREHHASRAFVAVELRRLRAAGRDEDAIQARYRWRERAAICEYDGCLPRVQAESLAAADLGALDHPGAELRHWREKILFETAARQV